MLRGATSASLLALQNPSAEPLDRRREPGDGAVDDLLDREDLVDAACHLARQRDRRFHVTAEVEIGRVAELRKQAAEAEGKLTRLYEAIENGLADMGDSNLKGRISELSRIRDSARADAERAESRNENHDNHMTPDLLRRFGIEARKKIRKPEGSFRRHHIQSLVQRVEVGRDEIRIKGSRPRLLQTLVASGAKPGVDTAAHGVRSFVPKWLPE